MATEVTMPRLSDSMEEGTIVEWLVAEGDPVKRGEPIVEIETDKATMPYEAEADGVLLKILVGVGDAADLGATIAIIGAPGEAYAADGDAPRGGGEASPSSGDAGGTGLASSPAELEPVPPPVGPPAGAPPEAQPAMADPVVAAAAPSAPNGNGAVATATRVPASPLARRIARSLGVDLASITGTGPKGRVVRADVEAAAAVSTSTSPAPTPAPAPPAPAAPAPVASAPARPAARADTARGDVERHDLSRLQQTVARRMSESRATVPEFELRVDVDMSAAVELRERLRALGADPLPSYNDMIVKASAIALTEFPRVNGSYKDGTFEEYARVNVGVAVAADDALVVPVVPDADQKSLGQLAKATRALAAKVRDNAITPPELSGGTFTVSNLGMFGVDSFSAVINVPQAAILAVGAMKPKAIVVDGEVVARPVLTLTLACDHRILYGADGAKFLSRLRDLLEQPLLFAL